MLQYPEKHEKEELKPLMNVYFSYVEIERFSQYVVHELEKNVENKKFLELIAIVEEKIKLNQTFTQSNEGLENTKTLKI